MKEQKRWYYGTRKGEWFLSYPKDVDEYKREEGISQSDMKKLGKEKAKEIVLSPTFYIGGKKLKKVI